MIPALVIAEERTEYAVKCAAHRKFPHRHPNEIGARQWASALDLAMSCGPHRVVSRRVIVTEWASE